MRKASLIILFGVILGSFYTNCTPNQFSLKESPLLAEQQQQDQPQAPPSSPTTTTQSPLSQSQQISWKNFYGIAWRGTALENVKHAKQMGYEYITLRIYDKPAVYKNNSAFAGLKFYVSDPQYWVINSYGYSPTLNTTKTYTQSQQDWYNQNMVWKSKETFPLNIATAWTSGASNTIHSTNWDFQQQAVIDMVVEKQIALFKSYEDTSLPFTFAGYIRDSSRLSGQMWRWDDAKNGNVLSDLTFWTGSDSGLLHDGITHEYSTYTEGMLAYFKKLNSRMKQEFPDAKWMLEPWKIYNTSSNDEWINQIKNRVDKVELTPDMLFQEGPGTEFVDDSRIFNSGVNITKDMVGSTQPDYVGEDKNRLYAAKAGINGAWYHSFGRWGGSPAAASNSNYIPNFQSVTEVYPRLKLIKCIPNWDNLNNVPLSDRSWDGSVYQSTKSYIGSEVMYSRQPKTGKLFAVFNTINGVIKLNAGETVTSLQNTDEYFIESGDATADFNISGNEIRLKRTVIIDTDSSSGQIKGKGYIFTIIGD